MFRKLPVRFLGLSLVLILFSMPGWGARDVGKALEEAMKSRASGSIEEVTRQFHNAAEQTANPEQKTSIMFFLAEFLMEQQEWGKAIEAYKRILTTGTKADQSGVYYSIAQAHLMRNQPEKAKALCAIIKANYPSNTMEEFANYMKGINPNGVHAKLAEFFAESPSGDQKELSEWVVTASPEKDSVGTHSRAGFEPPAHHGAGATTKPTEVATEITDTEETRVAIGAKGWHSDLAGHIDSKGMSLELSDDTDIGAQTQLAINGSWKFSEKDQLLLDYSQFDHNGSLNRAITFDKLLYNPKASIKLRTSLVDVGLSRRLNESEHGSWKLLYGMKFSKTFMRLAQPTVKGTQTGEINCDFSVPYLGIEGSTKLSNNVTLNGSAKYFSLNKSNAAGRLTDFDVALLFGRDYTKEPAETEWYGTLGYRFFLLHAKADNDSAEVRYSGPTFGIESRF